MSGQQWLGMFVLATMCAAESAHAKMQITEWMYNGLPGGNAEFVEFTNLGTSPVDMTDWSFDDASGAPGSFSLSTFGIVAPKESVIMTEITAAAFRTDWGLPLSVKVIGGNSQNMSRSDAAYLFNAAGTLVDRLVFNDQAGPGLIRTQNVSGNPETFAALGINSFPDWVLSVPGDRYGSYTSIAGNVGNPGTNVVPEPHAMALLLIGALVAAGCRQRGR